MTYSFAITGLTAPTRLDRALQGHQPAWGRSAVRALIEGCQVRVNGQLVWLCSWQVRNGDRIELLALPEAKPQPFDHFDDAWIIAEEADLAAVDKPAGLLSESPRWRQAANLLDLARQRFGPVHLFHRLDRDTSGVVVLTRSAATNRYLDAAFKQGAVLKEYLAVVAAPNQLQADGVIHLPIGRHPARRDMVAVVQSGGQRAVTRYQIIHEDPARQWLLLWPETGRTHQLRVHLAHMGAPILGDRLYNPGDHGVSRLMLHAARITLPASDAFPRRTFTAPLPVDFLPWPAELGKAGTVG